MTSPYHDTDIRVTITKKQPWGNNGRNQASIRETKRSEGQWRSESWRKRHRALAQGLENLFLSTSDLELHRNRCIDELWCGSRRPRRAVINWQFTSMHSYKIYRCNCEHRNYCNDTLQQMPTFAILVRLIRGFHPLFFFSFFCPFLGKSKRFDEKKRLWW